MRTRISFTYGGDRGIKGEIRKICLVYVVTTMNHVSFCEIARELKAQMKSMEFQTPVSFEIEKVSQLKLFVV